MNKSLVITHISVSCACVRACVWVRLSVCRSVGLSVCRSVGLSVCRSVCMSVCRSACVYVVMPYSKCCLSSNCGQFCSFIALRLFLNLDVVTALSCDLVRTISLADDIFCYFPTVEFVTHFEVVFVTCYANGSDYDTRSAVFLTYSNT